jgi:hypothetical protein
MSELSSPPITLAVLDLSNLKSHLRKNQNFTFILVEAGTRARANVLSGHMTLAHKQSKFKKVKKRITFSPFFVLLLKRAYLSIVIPLLHPHS